MSAATINMTSNHKISQETFDETLLENQELFEMSNEEAIAETISQFSQQGIKDISTYILTTHPETKKGIQQRKVRSIFTSHLNALDDLVNADGTVNVEKACVDDGDGQDKSVILSALDGVLQFCDGTYEEVIPIPEEDEGENESECDDEKENDGNKDPKKLIPTKYEKAMPFLTLFHSNDGLYTLMSLLSIVPIVSNNDADVETTTTPTQMNTLRRVANVTTALLTPRKASERVIKAQIRDKFVIMERLIRLISLFVTMLQKDDDASDSDQSEDICETLSCLINLATAACRSSERNKVAFVRALKNARRNEKDYGGKNNNRCNSTIALIVKALYVAVEKYKQQQQQQQQQDHQIKLMTEMCKLITVLCRFDDFRSDSSASNGGLGVDSSMGMNVSSSHDHVLEFNRSGVVPTLHDVSCIALGVDVGASVNVDVGVDVDVGVSDEDRVALAGAALSATRVLAVNDEIVQAMVAVGTLKVVKLALEMGVKEVSVSLDCCDKKDQIKMQRQHLTSGAIGLVRNLCGNDEIKTTLCLGHKLDAATSTLPTILQGMRLYRSNAAIQEHGCGTLAAMALRKPANALRIVQDDGPREIMNALRQFPNNVLVQRQGALAVRNIVSRLVANTSSMKTTTTDGTGSELGDNAVVVNATANVTANVSADATASENTNKTSGSAAVETMTINVKDVFLDLGAEIILRQITGRHQGSVDEAYAALRDLGCQISMVKYDAETNTTKRRTEMFGEVKSNFRPVYEESSNSNGTDMQERIARHAAKNGM